MMPVLSGSSDRRLDVDSIRMSYLLLLNETDGGVSEPVTLACSVSCVCVC